MNRREMLKASLVLPFLVNVPEVTAAGTPTGKSPEKYPDYVKQWCNTGLLDEIAEEKKASMAACLESQRLFNEIYDVPTQFKAISIPLVLRMFTDSEVFKNNNLIHPNNNIKDFEIFEIYELKTKYKPEEDLGYLEHAAEMVAVMSLEAREEIDELFSMCNKNLFSMKNKNIIFGGIWADMDSRNLHIGIAY